MAGENQIQPEYVNSRIGTQLLGVRPAKFFYHVERGDIATEPGRKRKDNRYRVSDILKLKQRLAEQKAKPDPVLIDWLQSRDVPSALRLSQIVYHDEIDLAEAALYQSWRKNNNQLTMAAFSKDRLECLAFLLLVPLDEQIILDILSGKRDDNSIKPEEIQSYNRPGAYTLLVVNSAVHPDRPDLLYKILYKVAEFWIQQFPDRYILRIYAQVVTDLGDTLVQHFFMAPRYDLAPNAYMLDLARPGASKIIRWFQAQLRQKAPLPAELCSPYLLDLNHLRHSR